MASKNISSSKLDGDELRQLEFIRNYAEYYTELAKSMYSQGRKYVPSSLEGTFSCIESKVVDYSAPIASEIQDCSVKYLKLADSQVDFLLDNVGKYQAQAVETFESNRSFLKECLDRYTEYIQEGLQKAKSINIEGKQQAFDLVESILNSIKALPQNAYNDAFRAVQKLMHVWEKLIENPKVAQVVEAVQPGIDAAKTKYLQMHKLLVSHPLYHSAFTHASNMASNVGSTMQSMQNSSIAKTASPYVERVKSYVEPVINSSAVQGAVHQIVQHMQPTREAGSHAKAE